MGYFYYQIHTFWTCQGSLVNVQKVAEHWPFDFVVYIVTMIKNCLCVNIFLKIVATISDKNKWKIFSIGFSQRSCFLFYGSPEEIFLCFPNFFKYLFFCTYCPISPSPSLTSKVVFNRPRWAFLSFLTLPTDFLTCPHYRELCLWKEGRTMTI